MQNKEKASGYIRTDCRMCRGSNLHTFLDFGEHPHSDGFIPPEKMEQEEPFYPLACNLCTDCGQVQLTYTVYPEVLYGEDYVYDGSITETGRKHFLNMATTIVEERNIEPGSLVIDIGSNVGLLLSGFKENGMKVLGVDPSIEPTKLAKERGIDTVVECFTEEVAKKIVEEHGKAEVITGTNVFAHIDDLDDLMRGAEALLSETGILVFESPYALDMFQDMEYDTIYHQHLSYLSIKPLKCIFERFGFELFDVIRTEIHGGSIRFFACRKGQRDVQPIVGELIAEEEAQGIHTKEYVDTFAQNVKNHRDELTQLVTTLIEEGNTVVGIGAPAKGMTLLNYCEFDTSVLPYLTEKTPWKIGRFAPGTHIPIYGDEKILEDQPDYALILPWNFAPEIMKNLSEYQERGGKFIIPIPTPAIV